MNNAQAPITTQQQVQLPDGELSAQTREAVLEKLRALQDVCLASKRQLHDREAFRAVQASCTAVAAAIRIVEKLPMPHAGN